MYLKHARTQAACAHCARAAPILYWPSQASTDRTGSKSINQAWAFFLTGHKSGQVQLIDLARTEKSPVEIPAHQAALTCLALNASGTRLATASEKVSWFKAPTRI